jgi:hypothetical protein
MPNLINDGVRALTNDEIFAVAGGNAVSYVVKSLADGLTTAARGGDGGASGGTSSPDPKTYFPWVWWM